MSTQQAELLNVLASTIAADAHTVARLASAGLSDQALRQAITDLRRSVDLIAAEAWKDGVHV